MIQVNAGPADAEIVLKLYDLRRESVMREARAWVVQKFQPQSADDILKVAQAWGTQENAYFRQVTSFWEMAASLVLRGAVNPDLFMDWSGEMVFMFAKFHPFLAEVRERMHQPKWLGRVEEAIQQTGRDRQLQDILALLRKMAERRAQAQ
ncbi:MAG TPA: hypothetical protein VEG32_08450 [Clostridia bacterium]|nr:hypothetical protein [Clostridia bacterium]